MGRADYFEQGGWNAACFRCGAKRKASEMKRQWQGYYVCPEHWEPRHPQDFVKAVPDVEAVPWSQPEDGTAIPSCSLTDSQAIPGLAIPGCMIPSRQDQVGQPGQWQFCTITSNQPLADVGTADCATVTI